MIEFKPVRLEDRAVIERYTMPSGICNCDLAFANMYCWQAVFHSAWAEIGGFLVIRFQIDGGERIGVEELAAAAGTISNEVLSRLGPRLGRVYAGGEAPGRPAE